MAQNIPSKDHFEQAYEGKAPWDIGKPQPVFVEAADQITGSVLDAGCGTGENALFFAQRGHKATGIDYLEQPITEAKGQRGGHVIPSPPDGTTVPRTNARMNRSATKPQPNLSKSFIMKSGPARQYRLPT